MPDMNSTGVVSRVEMTVNGVTVSEEIPSRMLLCDFLRQRVGLTGTHVGCEQGVCGACTVHLNGKAVRSCLIFAVQASGGSIDTIESVADNDILHPLQSAFHENHALQCGYCTPGIIMSTLYLEKRDMGKRLREMSRDEIRNELSGNLCRCTGYGTIVDAIVQYRDRGIGTNPATSGEME